MYRGKTSPSRVIMLVDLDYFFAQCEEVRNPSLKDKPVVVCVYSGRSRDSGAVSTANYVARKYGVKSGIPISLAKRRLADTDAVFLPVDHEFYGEVSRKIMGVLRGYADRFEQVGIDEAYLDVSRRVEGNFDKAEELAGKIKEDVKARQGLTCSVGVGPNKLVAKIAADSQKPNGLTIVKPEEAQSFLSPMPVNRLIGVGSKTAERMRASGINTIGDLAGYDVQRLIEVFGRKLGVYFHNASHGVDDEPVQEQGEAESISRISTLKEDTRDLEVILREADRLCEEVYTELLRGRLRFRQVGIIAVMKDMSVHSRSETFENTTDKLELLKKAVKQLFRELLEDSNLDLRRVGVKVSYLTKEQISQRKLTNF